MASPEPPFVADKSPRPLASSVPLRIAYVPYADDGNGYISRMCEIVSGIGVVAKFPGFAGLVRDSLRLRSPRFDILVANWIDNKIVSRSGRPSIGGIAVLFMKALLYRIWARRVVFVRHNRYPHRTAPQYARVMSRVLDVFERLCSAVISHSGADLQGRRFYCPHPLYEVTPCDDAVLPPELDQQPGYFVVFGRIEPYKGIDALIDKFPANRRLIVIGMPGDADYVARLQRMQRENVTVVPGFLADAQAQKIIRRARGMVLSHADEDVIVSGSFFYALSLGVPVFSLQTPFMKWIAPQLGDQLLVTAPELEGLCSRMATCKEIAGTATVAQEHTRQLFGDEAVRQAFMHTVLTLFNGPTVRASKNRPL
jgi:beta-1,4-mannosyltransferase